MDDPARPDLPWSEGPTTTVEARDPCHGAAAVSEMPLALMITARLGRTDGDDGCLRLQVYGHCLDYFGEIPRQRGILTNNQDIGPALPNRIRPV